MDALQVLKETAYSNRGSIGRAIVILWEGGYCNGYEYLAALAADELAALRAERDELREVLREISLLAPERNPSTKLQDLARAVLAKYPKGG